MNMLKFGDDSFDPQMQSLVDDWRLIRNNKQLGSLSHPYSFGTAYTIWCDCHQQMLDSRVVLDRLVISKQVREMLWEAAPYDRHVTDRTAGGVGRLLTNTIGEC